MEREAMFNWNRRSKPASAKRPRFRPTVEGLEDRQLLSGSGMTAPVIDGISDQTLATGGPLFVPVTAADGNNSLIGYTATSSDPNVNVSVRQGFGYLKVTVKGMGDMVFQLFSDVAPNTSAIISTLVSQGFYTNLTFHRVIPNFVIQGGDPKGDGTGGPGFSFENETGPLSLFNGNGQLAMANSGGTDTNGSQFFVTIGPQTSLNGKYTLFGQLVRGFNVRDEIAALPTDPTTNKPTNPPVILSAQIIPDYTDTVLLIQAPANYNADPEITVTGANTAGAAKQTFHVQVGNGGTQLQDVQFVNRTYSTILNRGAEPSAVDYYTNLKNSGVSVQQIALQVQSSLEARESSVTSLFQSMLSRPAEAQALTTFTAYLNAGGTLAHIEATIAASQEYYQAQGATNVSWVKAVLKAATGSTSAPTDYVNNVAAMLNNGLMRQTYADSIFSSMAAAQFTVQGLYTKFLERTPGFSEYQPFAQAIVAGTPEDLIVMQIVGSPEFYNFTKNQNNPTLTASTTTASSSGTPSVFGQSVTFKAIVASGSSSSTATPTGTVTFTDSTTNATLGTGTLDATGTATLAVSSLAVGSHTVLASYAGDSTFSASSNSTTQAVSMAATTTALATSIASAQFGQSVTLTATIAATAPGAGTPTGSVTFEDEHGNVLGTVAVNSSSKAVLAVSSLAVGSHTVSAIYSGDTNFTTSNGSAPLTVTQSGSSTVVASSANPSNPGDNVILTATVTAAAPGAGTPTGTVTFVDQTTSTTLGTGTVGADGKAAIAVSTLTSGSHSIVATYNGDVNFETSLGSITQVVS
jgi:cyclophilin family peptidyl-prolyl cis-trans isomerase